MLNLQINQRIFNSAYLPYLSDYSHRYLVFYGGAGSGKSVFAVQRTIIKALKEKRKILFIRKVATTIKDSIFELVRSTLDQFQILHLCKINLTNYSIELPNGSTFLFKGLDNQEKIKSITDITDIVIEEATELNYDDFSQLNLRLRHPYIQNQEIVLMFNPVSKANWVYKHFFEQKVADAAIVHTTYKDNRFLPETYVNSLLDLQRHNEAFYKIYALGDFATLDKLIFPHFKTADIAEQCLSKPKVVGCDFGFTNDPTAIVEVYCDAANKRIFITGEIYKTGMMINDIASSLVEAGFNHYPITCDSSEPRTVAELRRLGINAQAAKKGKDSIIHGITWLQGCDITIDVRCKHVIEEFENYTWEKDKNTNEYFNTPIDKWNHTIDALRYAVERYATGNTVKTMNKSLLGL